MKLRQPLIEKIVRYANRKKWWHVPPQDPKAYLKRGKFLASSFAEAEFWGRPLDEPQHVAISRPLVGDETSIEKRLFGRRMSSDEMSVKQRWALDLKMRKAALAEGFDSIVLMTEKDFAGFRINGKLPRSIELNVLDGGRPSRKVA